MTKIVKVTADGGGDRNGGDSDGDGK